VQGKNIDIDKIPCPNNQGCHWQHAKIRLRRSKIRQKSGKN